MLDTIENAGRRNSTPLPRLQLFITFLIQFAEPLTALVIYPFVNQFIRDTGITKGDETKTGYYTGLIESIFFLAESSTAMQWGYLSDRFGRRPILLLAPLGLSVSTLLFGLSTTFWPLVVFRCLQGVFNGNIGVAKTVIAEITDETNIGDAYAYAPMFWSSATTIAPLIGGVLSQPAERWPDTFGRFPFFRSHPYALPCAAASSIAFLCFAIAFLALKETRPSIVANEEQPQQPHAVDAEAPLITSQSDNNNYGAINTSSLGEAPAGPPPCLIGQYEIRKTTAYTLVHRPLLLVYLNYIFYAFLNMSNAVLVPLMYSTPLEYGGLGLNPFTIGIALGISGIINAIFQAIFFGRLVRRFGVHKLFKIVIVSPCVIFPLYFVIKDAAKRAGGVDGFLIVWITIHLAFRIPLSTAFGSLQILVVQSLPEGGLLGTANGCGQMLASGTEAVASAFASSLFSISLQRNLADGNFVYYCLFGVSLLAVCISWLLRDPRDISVSQDTNPRAS